MNRYTTMIFVPIIIIMIHIICFPLLASQDVFSGGSGTEEDPFLVTEVIHLVNLANRINEGTSYTGVYFKLMNDLDIGISPYNEGEGWVPIGSETNRFEGNFLGGGNIIAGLYINRQSDYQGLFGYLDGASIENLGLVDVDVTGTVNVGGLAGRIDGSRIENCFSLGNVKGENRMGGLIGSVYSGSAVSNSYTRGSVKRISGTDSYIGGFCGLNHSSAILNSYSASAIEWEGTPDLENNGFCTTVYSPFDTIEMTGNFWDMETSGQVMPGSFGEFTEGRTTTEMQTYGTFANAAWKFKVGTNEGYMWNIGNGRNDGYPYLDWQYPNDPFFDPVFAGGDGSEGNPFRIVTHEHLYNLRYFLNDSTVYFHLMNDIDLSEEFDEGGSYLYGGPGWIPIGHTLNRYRGVLDGQGYTIRGLFINRSNDYQGLFGSVDAGEIKNLNLEDVKVFGDRYTGGLAGYVFDSSIISNCFVMGEVHGTWGVGGLLGTARHSTVTGCGSECLVYGQNEVGGLIGSGSWVTISFSSSAGAVISTTNSTGGLVGNAYTSTINECFSTSNVNGGNHDAGGLVGIMGQTTIINDSYSTGNVTGGHRIGGFVGYAFTNSVISNSYSTGLVHATSGTAGGFMGGILSSTVQNSFWDLDTSEQNSSAAGIGKTTMEMNTTSTFTNAGWNFVDVWREDTDSTQNSGYPYLRWQDADPESTITSVVFAGGSGTEQDPFQVETAEQLDEVRNYSDKHFIQIADIDLGSAPWNDAEGWLPVGNTVDVFSGTYDGQNFLIDNLYIDRPGEDGIGLFGTVSGTVRNLRVKGSVIGRNNTGGVVGWLAGVNSTKPAVLESVVFDGSVTGNLQVGGIAGILYKDGEIRSCVSMGAVTSVSDGSGAGHGVGGITGYGGGVYGHTLVESCYSTAIVTGTSTGNSVYQGAGGIIGYVGGGRETKNCWFGGVVTGGVVKGGIVGGLTEGARVTNCYSYGTVTESGTHVGGIIGRLSSGTVTNSYFDTEVSGQINCAGGIGRTTEEMTYPYDSDTYVNWDFDEIWQEDTNGTLNGGYPFLIRQHIILEPMYVLTLQTNPEDGGTVSGSGNYKEGAQVMLSAAPADGFEFVNWMMNGNILLNGEDPAGETFEFHMPANDVVVTAIFSSVTAVTHFTAGIPNDYVLYQNYPNPFNPSTVIRYGLPERAYVRLAVYNNLGQKVSELVNREQDAGYYEVNFDAGSLSSGIYIYRIQAGEYVTNKKFILLK